MRCPWCRSRADKRPCAACRADRRAFQLEVLGQDRGNGAVDGILGFCTLVIVMVAFAPKLAKFTALSDGALDPFSALLLALFVPLAIISVLIGSSVGSSR